MAGLGRVTAAKATAWAALALLFFLQWGELVESTEYLVGGDKGWTLQISDWPSDIKFSEGDVLLFLYVPGAHNVVKVNEEGYLACAIDDDSEVYTSGDDRITLDEGTNYFICSYPGHCNMGMKIAVQAE